MKIADCKVGGIYFHSFGAASWLIKVTKIVRGTSPLEWTGVLVGNQHGFDDGDPIWGRIHELSKEAL